MHNVKPRNKIKQKLKEMESHRGIHYTCVGNYFFERLVFFARLSLLKIFRL